jgi:hypothetical protein
MTRVEHWRWRYRDPKTGEVCYSSCACTSEEAGWLYGEAERIEGTLVLIDVDLKPEHSKDGSQAGGPSTA